MMKKNYQFFYLKTGGGHLAPAKALAKKISGKTSGNVQTVLVDGLDGGKPWLKKIVEDGYRTSVNNAKWVFEFLYFLNKIELVARLSAWIICRFTYKSIERKIVENPPEKIIILHFFLIKPVVKTVRKHKLNIPIITVVTDPYTAHPIWFIEKNNREFIVFSEELKKKILQKKKNVDLKVTVFPFILDDIFSKPMTESEVIGAKLRYGYSLKKKSLLIVGGGDGIPKGRKILKQLRNINTHIEIILVCGHNKKLYDYALKLKEKYSLDNLKIYEFVDFIYDLINISDVVITKCGASTFMEILLMKRIPVVNNYIWEQELGNVDFIRKNKLGIYEKRISKLPKIIDEVIADANLYGLYTANINNIKLENGTEKVANYIINNNEHISYF